jgi:hypothetical protein
MMYLIFGMVLNDTVFMTVHFHFTSDCLGRAKKGGMRLELNGTHQLLIYAADSDLFHRNMNTIKK